MPTHTQMHTNIHKHILTYRGAVPNPPFVSIRGSSKARKYSFTHARTHTHTHTHTQRRSKLGCAQSVKDVSVKTHGNQGPFQGVCLRGCVSGGQVPTKTRIPPIDPQHDLPPHPNSPQLIHRWSQNTHFHPQLHIVIRVKSQYRPHFLIHARVCVKGILGEFLQCLVYYLSSFHTNLNSLQLQWAEMISYFISKLPF